MNNRGDKNRCPTDVNEVLSEATAAVDRWIEDTARVLTDLSDRIWDHAEVGLQEIKSARVLQAFLQAEGFEIESGAAGMPSSFVAGWGSGRPVIGFLGEYDALPGLSQKPIPVKDPLRPGAPGHGCGHNLLGVGAAAAAAAMKREMERLGIEGTVRYYGCPAEELLTGKVFMVRAGLFDDVDAAITWHPGFLNTVWNNSSNALNSARFTFHGRTAHAAGDPHHGRSALDAVELMNIGANYLREHIIEKARIHYVITDGGGEPNVVPARAQVWYYVRAPERSQVDEIYARVLDIARGAALMTETTWDVEFLAGCYNYLPNKTINGLLQRHMEKIGPNKWTGEELEFAQQMNESLPPGQKAEALKAAKVPAEVYAQLINDTILPARDDEEVMAGSTDVGDVSWVAPTGQVSTAAAVLGLPGHSWQCAACFGMGVGHKGMLQAAKIMALAGLELAVDPVALARARDEWAEQTRDNPYRSPIPNNVEPCLNLLPTGDHNGE